MSVLLAGCDSGGGHAPAGTAPTLAQARALLGRHAAAVLAHSPSRYLADVDTATAAAAFRAQEQHDIADLAGVPLSSWAYADATPVTDTAVVAAATKRYGAPALIVHVTLEYRLRGVDVLPARHALYLTVVDRDGTAVLSGDDDLAHAGSPSWAGPWRFGPLQAVRGTTTLVLGPKDAPLADVAAAVDRAVPAVTAVWGASWNRSVAVIVTGSAAEFSALVGSGEKLQDVSAAAVTDGIDPISHRPYGQRLIVAPGAFDTLSAVGAQIVLRHELTHLATAAITDPTTPRWVVEGYADYVGLLGSGQPVTEAAQELRAAVRDGRVPSALPAEKDFAARGAALARAYEESWLACRLIAAKAGTAGLTRFYRTAADALEAAPEALADGLRTATGLTLDRFTAQWRAYLRDQLS